VVGFRCSYPNCEVNFLPTDLEGDLIPKHTRNNLVDEVLDCPGSLEAGLPLTANDVPKVRDWSFWWQG
jgi:hypothetical protein